LKFAATIVLLILASFPFLIAPWIFLPILAGALVALAIYLGKPSSPTFQKIVRWAKAISVGIAVAIALGFVFLTPLKPARTSVASKANIFISKLPGVSQRPVSQTIAAIEADRLSLSTALQMERQRVTVVSRALNLYQVARAEYHTQANAGKPDEELATALKDFETLFAKERPDPENGTKTIRLLSPDQLDAHLARANQAIDKLEADGTAIGANSQDLRRFKLSIPGALSDLELDQLYLATTNLQDRLKSSLEVQLSAESTYSIKFDRDGDTLTSQQDIRIRLSDNPASDIDLTGFFTSKDGHLGEGLDEEVRVQEDSSPEQLVSPKQPVFRLRSGINSILISKRIVRHSASEPVSTGLLPLQFSMIQVNWPLPHIHALTLGLQEGGDPNSTWPFILPVENKDNASLGRIVLPRYSFYFSDPAIKVSTTASSDELIPSSKVGNLRALLPGSAQTIRVEMSPRYLSNSPGQKLKDYFAIENIVAALIIWLITVAVLSVFKSKGDNRKTVNTA
jgi:hypothetical protein